MNVQSGLKAARRDSLEHLDILELLLGLLRSRGGG
jgi:hypothetical protein